MRPRLATLVGLCLFALATADASAQIAPGNGVARRRAPNQVVVRTPSGPKVYVKRHRRRRNYSQMNRNNANMMKRGMMGRTF
ncbi:MAG: hypothetical protein KGM43_02800 [Planctomycetota bacterium]|nr:hypothetical protein [Planctomycetota bacterium]